MIKWKTNKIRKWKIFGILIATLVIASAVIYNVGLEIEQNEKDGLRDSSQSKNKSNEDNTSIKDAPSKISDYEKMCGVWKNKSAIIGFYIDGTGRTFKPSTDEFTWNVSNGILVMNHSHHYARFEMIYTFSNDGNTLTITMPGKPGTSIVLTKIEDTTKEKTEEEKFYGNWTNSSGNLIFYENGTCSSIFSSTPQFTWEISKGKLVITNINTKTETEAEYEFSENDVVLTITVNGPSGKESVVLVKTY